MHLDKRQEERWKLRPQVYMCSSREDEHHGARAMEKASRFQEGGRPTVPNHLGQQGMKEGTLSTGLNKRSHGQLSQGQAPLGDIERSQMAES